MSKYAEERMDLDLATCDTFERTVVHPLLSSVERLSLDREASMNRSVGIPTLERRIGALDAQMTHHINVTMSDAKMDKLDSIHDNLQRNIQPEIRIENNKSNKIEGGIVQRFESVVGTINRNFLSEGASRYVRNFFQKQSLVMGNLLLIDSYHIFCTLFPCCQSGRDRILTNKNRNWDTEPNGTSRGYVI